MRKTFTKAELKKGIGDFYYRKKEWAEKAAKASRRKGFSATIHGSRGRWEVRVRQSK